MDYLGCYHGARGILICVGVCLAHYAVLIVELYNKVEVICVTFYLMRILCSTADKDDVINSALQ